MNNSSPLPTMTVIRTGMGKDKQEFSSRSIMYLLGDDGYSTIVRNDAPTVFTSKCLAVYEQLLPEFIRIHKHCLVNPNYIESANLTRRQAAYIQLKNGQKLKVSRLRALGLRAQFAPNEAAL